MNANISNNHNVTGDINQSAAARKNAALIAEFLENVSDISYIVPIPNPVPPAREVLALLHDKLQDLTDEHMACDTKAPSYPAQFARINRLVNLVADKAEALENLLAAQSRILNPKPRISSPNSSEPTLDEPLPAPNQPQPEASQIPATSQPEASHNPASTQPPACQTPDPSQIFEATADPRSPLDALPIEDQELIFDTLQTHGIRPSIPLLAKPRARGGLGQSFTRSALTTFLPRFRQRLAKTNRALARETTGADVATAHLKARLIDAAFEPDLSDAAITRVITNLHRLQSSEVAHRRLALAERRCDFTESRDRYKRGRDFDKDVQRLAKW